MKKLLTALCVLAAPVLALAQPLWQDINATSEGADTRRTELVFHAQRADALSRGFRDCSNYLDLNGIWDFLYADNWRNLPPLPGLSGAAWSRIRVPGNWEVQGFGTPIYVNQPYEFCPKNPQPPALPDAVPAALYRRTFTVPEAWNGRAVFLNLCGVKSGCYVYVNGEQIGYCEDSKSLARFNITRALRKGDNELVLKVFRFSTGSYLECQDFWRISGIERDVYLSSEKRDTGFDFSVVSTLDPSLENGLFQLKFRSREPVEVFYELLDSDGTALCDAVYTCEGERTTSLEILPGVRKWSAETPNLYTLLLRVDGEYARFRVGFRRIEIASADDHGRSVKALLVNGQSVKFKGVNLHEHHPRTGHYLNRENMLDDLRLMRGANINAIRTCHYPQPREFYELCDSLGFYVYDEANIESHGMGYRPERTLGNNPAWETKHLDRILNLYRRTANYPCVTILSLGNEAGNGVNFYAGYKVLKALEEGGMNRPVCYERAEREWNTDMLVPQYPGTDWFALMAQKESQRPVCPSEYAHAMGNSTGSLDRQWEVIYDHTHLQGGFIWDWADQGLYDPERIWTYGGDYGENTPSDANFLCNGIVNPDRKPHPAYYEVKHVYQDVSVTPVEGLRFRVFNRFYFKDLSGYKLRWRIERDGKRIRWGTLPLSALPQQADTVELKPWFGKLLFRKGGEYRVRFEVVSRADAPLLPKGSIVAVDEALLQRSGVRKPYVARGDAPAFVDSDAEIRVSGRKVALVFDKVTGAVKSWQVGGRDVIDPQFGLKPVFWRPPTDNDYGNREPLRTLAWKEASLRGALLRSSTRTEGACTVITAVYALPQGAVMTTEYRIFPSGIVRVESAFKGGPMPAKELRKPLEDPLRLLVEIPRLGWRMHVGEDAFRYFGRGPVENYADRRSCTAKSIYQSTASGEFFPYVRPQETGHHTETGWLQIGKLCVVADETFEFNALRQSVEDLDCEEALSRPYQWQNFSPSEKHEADSARNVIRRQTHLNDVPVRDFTELCIDYRMSGVGGYDSWGSRPEPDVTLWPYTDFRFGFTLVPAEALSPRKAVKMQFNDHQSDRADVVSD